MLNRQTARHQAERAAQTQQIEATEQTIAGVRAKVAAPLVEQGAADGATYPLLREQMIQATAAQADAGRLRKRATTRTLRRRPR